MEIYEVLSPVGNSFAGEVSFAPRLDTLAGKTICEVSTGDLFRCSWSFPIIRDVLQKRYPDAKIVPFTEFPNLNALNMRPEKREQQWAALRAALKNQGCDAVISQIGA
jgi:hypothetical protein